MSKSGIKVDGGMSKNNWFLQFLSDITRVNIIKPDDIESTVRGAAMLAAIGSGIYKSIDALDNITQNYSNYHPKLELDYTNQLYSGWQEAINKVLE